MYFLVTGDSVIRDGEVRKMQLWGPFENFEEVEMWAARFKDDWWILQPEPPTWPTQR